VIVVFVLWWKFKRAGKLLSTLAAFVSLHGVMKITTREPGQNSDQLNAIANHVAK
jgi:hypothetical protein